MPKQMLQLNDFSGGLNTKSSPRDINVNQLTKADNAIVSKAGLIQSSKDAEDKSGNTDLNHASNHGNGAFLFTSQFDINNTDALAQGETPDAGNRVDETAREIVAYPDSQNIKFFFRNFNTTGNFSHAGTTNQVAISDGSCEPVYYFVDGSLYIADKDRVDTSGSFTQKVLRLLNKPRFGQDIREWFIGDAAPAQDNNAFEALHVDSSITNPSAEGEFEVSFVTTPTQPNISNITDGGINIVTTANPDSATDNVVGIESTRMFVTKASSPGDISSNTDLQVDDIIYLGDEAMKITANSSTSSTNVRKLSVTRGEFGTGILEYEAGTQLKKSTDEPIGGGGWASGQYEFTHTLVNYTGDETLPHTPISTTASITIGDFFSDINVRVNASNVFRRNEKGFRVYTRLKDTNDRFILFLDADYERGVRTNLFDEYTAWDSTSYPASGEMANVTGLSAKNPSLDTYESVTGYSQTEKSISLGTKGGYKAATVCSRRAWIANVRKDDVVYDDRIYYSPVNRFATFPDSFFLDIGINDGDSFTALHSLGDKLLAYKKKKLFIINVQSTSDAGWYLESEHEGVGCNNQESVVKTPFGICWVNDEGVFIYTGQSVPVEISLLLDDNTFKSNSGERSSIGYNRKYKQLVVCQDTTGTDDFLVYDFSSQGWSITKSMSNGMSNFIDSVDGLYFIEYANGNNNKVVKKLSGDKGVEQITVRTKDIDFGAPGKVKKIYKVYITAKDDGGSSNGNTLTLKYALNGSTSYSNATTATPTDGLGQFDTLVYTLGVDCESISFELQDESGEEIEINDISIEFRAKYKRAS